MGVSMAIAIVGGFFANYALAERHLLKCDPSFTEGLCHDGLCCLPISSHEITESSRFLGDLASNILAGWAIVSGMAFFIIKYDDEVDADDKFEQKVHEVLEKTWYGQFLVEDDKVREILTKKSVPEEAIDEIFEDKDKVNEILVKKVLEILRQKGVVFKEHDEDDSDKKERELFRKFSHEEALRDPDSRRSSIDTPIIASNV